MTVMKTSNFVTSDDYRVNVGNFDSKGLNVNNWSDDNTNYNIGLAASRNFFLCLTIKTLSILEGVLFGVLFSVLLLI